MSYSHLTFTPPFFAASHGSGMIHRSVPAAFQLRAAQVFFKCDPGYASFDGDDHIICTSQGTWLLAGIGVHEWGSHMASTKVKCWYNSDFSGISWVYEVYVYGSTSVRYLSTLTCCYRWVKCTNHLRICFFWQVSKAQHDNVKSSRFELNNRQKEYPTGRKI